MGRLIVLLLLAAGIAYLIPGPVEHYEASAEINTGRERVWEVLSDLSQLSRWNDEVDSTAFVTPQREGVGTQIRLDGKFMTCWEKVVSWEPFNRIEFTVTEKPALTTDHVLRYTMEPRFERTLVRVEEEYHMRGGYLGHALNYITFSRMREAYRGPALSYLKRLAETGVGLGT